MRGGIRVATLAAALMAASSFSGPSGGRGGYPYGGGRPLDVPPTDPDLAAQMAEAKNRADRRRIQRAMQKRDKKAAKAKR